MGLFGNSYGFEGLTVEHLQNVEKHRVLFLSGRRKVKNPREEHYGDMVMDMCCPVFRCLSLTTAMLIIYLAIFIAEAAVGI
jgi:hypothetical protein